MNIKIDLKYKILKGMMTAANVTGNVEVNFLGEFLGKGFVKKLIWEELSRQLQERGLTGTITIDDEENYV
jgi:hypothetical protein